MIAHYVVTRAAYGPAYPIDANRQRLALLRGITAQSLASQTERRWTWLVLIDPADPLIEERTDALRSAGAPLILLDDPAVARGGMADLPMGRWAEMIEWGPTVLTTRLDDDDALAPGAVAALRHAATINPARARAWTLPGGFRIAEGRVDQVWHPRTQFVTLQSPPGIRRTVMDCSHLQIATLAPSRPATRKPMWLWVRHELARSEHGPSSQRGRASMRPIDRNLRRLFAVDWSLIA